VFPECGLELGAITDVLDCVGFGILKPQTDALYRAGGRCSSASSATSTTRTSSLPAPRPGRARRRRGPGQRVLDRELGDQRCATAAAPSSPRSRPSSATGTARSPSVAEFAGVFLVAGLELRDRRRAPSLKARSAAVTSSPRSLVRVLVRPRPYLAARFAPRHRAARSMGDRSRR